MGWFLALWLLHLFRLWDLIFVGILVVLVGPFISSILPSLASWALLVGIVVNIILLFYGILSSLAPSASRAGHNRVGCLLLHRSLDGLIGIVWCPHVRLWQRRLETWVQTCWLPWLASSCLLGILAHIVWRPHTPLRHPFIIFLYGIFILFFLALVAWWIVWHLLGVLMFVYGNVVCKVGAFVLVVLACCILLA